MLKAEIYVRLKKTVSDPQGLTIKHALESLGYKNLEEVRSGKLITITLNSKDKKDVRQEIDKMCQKLLVNPIIEEYEFKITDDR